MFNTYYQKYKSAVEPECKIIGGAIVENNQGEIDFILEASTGTTKACKGRHRITVCLTLEQAKCIAQDLLSEIVEVESMIQAKAQRLHEANIERSESK